MKKEEEKQQEMLPSIIMWRKEEDGTLVPDGLLNKIKYDTWVAGLKTGEKVSGMFEQLMIDSTHAQNNYLHKLIGIISEDTGNSFEVVKRIIKEKTGLWATKTELKSVGDYSKAEMSRAIQCTIDLGSEFGINLYGLGQN